MVHYFFLLDGRFYFEPLHAALCQFRQERNLILARTLCQEMLKNIPGIPKDSLIAQVARDVAIPPSAWQTFAGELLAAGAGETPRIAVEPHLLRALLAGDDPHGPLPAREKFSPIHQVLFGARWVDFGVGVYRPDHAGINLAKDVASLTEYLLQVDPRQWRGEGLEAVWPDVEEDLADARDWWPTLVDMYQEAKNRGWLVMCEEA